MAPSPNGSDSNYIETEADASLVGKNCQYGPCNQLDFLPFKCQSCWQVYCIDHRTESSHACANPGAWAERKRLAQLARPSYGADKPLALETPRKPCDRDGCDSMIGTPLVPGIHCAGCNRDYCLSHRLLEDHDCTKLEPVGARPTAAVAAAQRRAQSTLERFKSWAAARKAALPARQPRANSTVARILAENAMKNSAKGDPKVPVEKRIYLHVEAEAQSAVAKVPRRDFFYSKDWVVGRVLDAAAQGLQVENVNNKSDDEEVRLRLFHVEGGRLLDFGEKLGDAVVTGNTIVLLRGVGPPPDLIDL